MTNKNCVFQVNHIKKGINPPSANEILQWRVRYQGLSNWCCGGCNRTDGMQFNSRRLISTVLDEMVKINFLNPEPFF